MKMSGKYSVLLFDLDGTLTDPGEGIRNSVAYALQKYGITVTEQESLNRFIGPPLQEGFQEFYGFSPKEAIRAVGYYREYYRDRGIYENCVYDGMEEVLKVLKQAGRHLVVATSKPEVFARQIISYFHLDPYFEYVAGMELDGGRGTKAEVIEYALEACKVPDRTKVLMIGDREHDVLGAKKAGIDCLGVLYGFGTEEELLTAGASGITATVEGILEYCL